MKKLLCVLLSLTAVFCLAGCEDGKCDDCGRKADDVEIVEIKGEERELCPDCALKAGLDAIGDTTIGDIIGGLGGNE